MFRIILLLLIIIPTIEIWGLIKVSQFVGGMQTIFIVIATGFFGAYLAKREGLKVWVQLQEKLSYGQIPTKAIMNGISVFIGGLLLLTAGLFTDTIGLLLILPYTRSIIQMYIIKKFRKKIEDGEIHFNYRRLKQ